MCDQISDAVLDAYLSQDPDSKVACGEFYCMSHVVDVSGHSEVPENLHEKNANKYFMHYMELLSIVSLK